jgi:sec-independent protein translocase protein TatA
MTTLFAFFGMGHWELLIVLVVVLLLFGNRLPGMMRSMGRSVVEFKKGIREDEEDPAIGDSDEPPKVEEA